jgi:hypothetical protein
VRRSGQSQQKVVVTVKHRNRHHLLLVACPYPPVYAANCGPKSRACSQEVGASPFRIGQSGR